MNMFKLKQNKGFTLIEVLIAMAIFVTFTSVMITSYSGIVKSQQEANEYRLMYSEARNIFDKLTDEIRSGAIYYPEEVGLAGQSNELTLIAKDGERAKRFSYESEEKKLCFIESEKAFYLNSDDVSISAMNFFVSPLKDPYKLENVSSKVLQFQPKVTFFARFEKELNNGKIFEADFHTTVSSRFYSHADSSKIDFAVIDGKNCSDENPLQEFNIEDL